jgi:hypothetical protein
MTVLCCSLDVFREATTKKEKISILIQEKQLVGHGKHSCSVTREAIAVERAKVGPDCVLVFITNCAAAHDQGIFALHRTVVITPNETEKAFGKFVSRLKLFCHAPSLVDA